MNQIPGYHDERACKTRAVVKPRRPSGALPADGLSQKRFSLALGADRDETCRENRHNRGVRIRVQILLHSNVRHYILNGVPINHLSQCPKLVPDPTDSVAMMS